VSDNNFLNHVNDQSKSIDVNTDEGAAIGRKHKTSDVTSVLEGHSLCDIGRQVEHVDLVADWAQKHLVHLVRVIDRSLLCED